MVSQGSGRAGYATREEFVAAEMAFLSGGSGNSSSSDTNGEFETAGSSSQLEFRREMLRQGMSTEEYESNCGLP